MKEAVLSLPGLQAAHDADERRVRWYATGGAQVAGLAGPKPVQVEARMDHVDRGREGKPALGLGSGLRERYDPTGGEHGGQPLDRVGPRRNHHLGPERREPGPPGRK